MKTKILFIFILILSLFLSACKKDKDDKSLAAMAMLYLFGQKTDSADNTTLMVTMKLINANTGAGIADTVVALDTGVSGSILANVQQPVKANTSSGSYETVKLDVPTNTATTDYEGKITLLLKKNVESKYIVKSTALGDTTMTVSFDGTELDPKDTSLDSTNASVQNAKIDGIKSNVVTSSTGLTYEVMQINVYNVYESYEANTIPAPLGVRFTDTDNSYNSIAGTITIEPPSPENVDGYEIYFAKNSSSKLDLIAKIPKGTTSYTLPTTSTSGKNYNYIMVYSQIGGVLSFGYAFVSILDSPDSSSLDINWGNNGSIGFYGTGDGQFNEPRGIAIAPNGDIYIGDMRNYRIQYFSSAGVFKGKFGSKGTGDGQFKRPVGISIASNGDVYVSDSSYDVNRVQYFSSVGVFKGKFGSLGKGDGEFDYPVGTAIDPISNNVLVVDSDNYRVVSLSSSGTYQKIFAGTTKVQSYVDGQLSYPNTIAINPSNRNVYIGDGNRRDIQYFSDTGTYLGKFQSTPTGIAIHSNNDVFVSNYDKIEYFSSAGTSKGTLKSQGYGRTYLSSDKASIVNDIFSVAQPVAIAIDTSGGVYVVDFKSNKIYKFLTSTSKYSIGGNISGSTDTAGLIVQNKENLETVTLGASATSFTFPTQSAKYEAAIKTQPTSGNTTCSVSSGGGKKLATANVNNIAVTCATTYKVTVNVSGHTGDVVIQNNAAGNQTIASGTSTFSFTGLANSANYAITVLTPPAGQTCTVTNGTGTISSANVTNVSITCTTNAVADTTVPTVGTPTLTTSSITSNGFSLAWTEATDNVTAQATLQYKVVRSTSAITSVALANSATVVQAYQVYSSYAQPFAITGLTASTTYHVNVVVKDAAGNESLYTSNSATTTAVADTTVPTVGTPTLTRVNFPRVGKK